MSESAVTLEEVLDRIGFIAKWEARGEAKGEARGEARGVAIGKEEGVAIGEARGKEEIARNMLNCGFSVEQIASLSGLDVEKINNLASP